MEQRELTPQEEIVLIQRKLGHAVAKEKPVKYWLDLGEPLLHSTLGSPEGIPYGKIIGLDGWESHGKTALAIHIAGKAQEDGADIGWIDPEDSLDAKWASKRGLDVSKVAHFKTELMDIKNKSGVVVDQRLKTAQEICEEAEAWIKLKHSKRPNGRLVVGIDSITSFLVEDESDAGIENQNMRTKSSLAQFVGQLFRRWTAVATTYNVMFIAINQIRLAPGVKFGNPEYNPGGKALHFYASVFARVRRAGGAGGRLRQDGKVIGMQGIVRNVKNKSGEGSEEKNSVGFKIYWSQPGIKFLPWEKIKDEGDQ